MRTGRNIGNFHYRMEVPETSRRWTKRRRTGGEQHVTLIFTDYYNFRGEAVFCVT